MTTGTSRKTRNEQQLDETVADSFPASDPPAHSGITGVRRRDKTTQPDSAGRPASHKRSQDERPTGLPNSDRHAMETAHSWEDDPPSQ
jgi:hypothetical protein